MKEKYLVTGIRWFQEDLVNQKCCLHSSAKFVIASWLNTADEKGTFMLEFLDLNNDLC